MALRALAGGRPFRDQESGLTRVSAEDFVGGYVEHVQESVVIDAPRPLVWRIYVDHASWTKWARIGKVRLKTEGGRDRDGVGCVRVIRNSGVSVEERVTEFEPPHRMAYRVVRGGLPMSDHLGEVEFFEADGATRIVWRCRFRSRLPFLGAPMRWIVGATFRRVLAGLKREVSVQGVRS